MAKKDSHSSIKDNVLVRALARWEWEGGRIERSRLPEEQDPLLQSPENLAFASAQHVREVVGIFAGSGDLQMAIDDLLSAGFDHVDLSLLASAAAVDEKLGHRFVKVETIADDQSLPRTAYVSPEAIGDAEGGVSGPLMYIGAMTAAGVVVASGGTLAALVTDAVAAGGSGGLIGGIAAKWIGSHHAHSLQDQLERGGLLLWVRAPDTAAESRAIDILQKHSGLDVHGHTLPAKISRIP